jgi:hypothetical protein
MLREGNGSNVYESNVLKSYVVNMIRCCEDISSLTKVEMRKIWQRLTSTFLFAIQTFCSQNEEKVKYARLRYVTVFLVQRLYLQVLRI